MVSVTAGRPAAPAPAAAIEVVRTALAAIARYERPDLEERLEHAAARLLDDTVRVLVVGEFKQGKSMLVNGLVGAPVCAVSDDVATAVPTHVRYGEQVSVSVLLARPDGADPQRVERIEVPAAQLAEHTGESGRRAGVTQVEVGIPRPVLAGGLELVDTPGIGGLSSMHGAATVAALPSADAVLLVSDASQEYTGPELAFLRQAVAVCPNVACALTKTDLYPQWRRIAELDRGHLAAAGIAAEVIPVSSTLRWQAVLGEDSELNDESGYPVLVRYLRRRVLGQADRLARRSTAQDVFAVLDQLAAGLRAEQTAQRDPEAVRGLVRTLSAAQERASELKERSARWQQTLGDGIADLNADIDHDLRQRLREIIRLAEDELSAGADPARSWDQLAGWVQQEVTSAASANFVWAAQRARWLARQDAEHFAADQELLLPALRTDDLGAHGGAVRPLQLRGGEQVRLGQQALTGLRGSYMGMLMFGMLGSLVGLSLLNPISIGAGVVMGGKAVGEEKRRALARRQAEARTAIRRHIDDVIFQVGKDSRDRLRGVQRELRDHFTAMAEQTKRSLADAVAAAERSVKASRAEREARLAEIQAELAGLETVHKAAAALLAGGRGDAARRPSAAAGTP